MLPAFLGSPEMRARFEGALVEHRIVIAQTDGEPVGFMWSEEFFGHAFVRVLAVAPQHRRRGHAGLLPAHAEKFARTDRVFTSTNRSNAPMHAVLARYGWRRCGEVDDLDPGDPEVFYVKYRARGVVT